jgi:acetyl-CoA acetyltransferase
MAAPTGRSTSVDGVALAIMGGVRTPFGRAKGVMGRFAPFDLARHAGEELLARCEIDPASLAGLVLCTAAPSSFPPFPARLLGRSLGLPPRVVTWTMSEGPVAALMALADVSLRGGRFLLVGADSATAAMGRQEGGQSVLDRISVDPDCERQLGADAEMVAAACGLGRDELDSLAIESHLHAARARDEGLLAEEILPLASPPDYEAFIREDQAIQAQADARRFGALPALTPGEGGIVTHATIALPADGAAALLVEPALDGAGALACVRRVRVEGTPAGESGAALVVASLLGDLDLELAAIDAIELYERSSAHVLAALRELGFGLRGKLNRWGGALALGDVPGATVMRHILAASLRLKPRQRGVIAASSGGLSGAALIEGSSR